MEGREVISLEELKKKYFDDIETLKKDIANGKVCVKCGNYGGRDIVWLVCDVQKENKVMLLCENGLCEKAYNVEVGGKSFEQSTLCKWLNDDFLKNNISVGKDTHVSNAIVQTSKDICLENVFGNVRVLMYIVLMSKEQAQNLLKVEKNQKSEKGKCYSYDSNKPVDWWLSSNLEDDILGSNLCRAYYVNEEGSLCSDFLTRSKMIYVRPVMWVDLSKL